jgi:CheY-like chemotaxis protein
MARIIVVDDYVDSANSLARLFRMTGHEVEVYHCPATCLAGWHAFRPDVMFLDINLPGMSGWELCELIRQVAGNSVLLVALTAKAFPEDVRRSMNAGFDHHLAKPYDFTRLSALVPAV